MKIKKNSPSSYEPGLKCKYFNKNPKSKRKLDRRHYNYKGKPKRSYKTEEDALEIIHKFYTNYKCYLCPICNNWHIGYIK